MALRNYKTQIMYAVFHRGHLQFQNCLANRPTRVWNGTENLVVTESEREVEAYKIMFKQTRSEIGNILTLVDDLLNAKYDSKKDEARQSLQDRVKREVAMYRVLTNELV
jgi:hypothetical protein